MDADKLISIAYKRCNFRVKPALHSSRPAASNSRSMSNSSDGRPAAAATKPVQASSSQTQTQNPPPGSGKTGNTSGRQLISPRLRTNQGLGAVPDVLVGIGLAHVGPRSAAASASTDSINLNNGDKEEEKIAFQRAHSWSIGRASMEAALPSDFNVKSTVSTDRINFGNRPVSISKATKTDPLRLSVNADYRYSEKERESIVAADLRLSAEYLSAQKLKNRGKKLLPTINGELNFYRADIAVWRRSFRYLVNWISTTFSDIHPCLCGWVLCRPALEERHSRMEVARRLWREQLSSNQNDESRSDSPTAVVNSDVDEENASPNPKATREDRPEHEQEDEGGLPGRGGASPIPPMDSHTLGGGEETHSDSSTTAPTGHKEHPRGGGGGGGGVKEGGILSLLRGRRSFTSTERSFPGLSPSSQVKNLDFAGAFTTDLSDVLNSTYNLDHEFERISDKAMK